MIPELLLACLLTGASLGTCRAEAAVKPGGCVATHSWGDLGWVKPEWPLYAAHIVASEARGVPSADVAIACTLVWDVVEGGYLERPFELHEHGRWNGWGTPDELDEEAVYRALLTDACANMRYQFVGNSADVFVWLSMRMITEGPHDLYIGPGGQSVVGVR